MVGCRRRTLCRTRHGGLSTGGRERGELLPKTSGLNSGWVTNPRGAKSRKESGSRKQDMVARGRPVLVHRFLKLREFLFSGADLVRVRYAVLLTPCIEQIQGRSVDCTTLGRQG